MSRDIMDRKTGTGDVLIPAYTQSLSYSISRVPDLWFPNFRWRHAHSLVFNPAGRDLTDRVVGVIRPSEDSFEVIVPHGHLCGLIGKDFGLTLNFSDIGCCYFSSEAKVFPKLMQFSRPCWSGFHISLIPSLTISNPPSRSFSVIIFTDSPLQP